MFRRLCQLSALAILGALLVFAPELLTAVSAPYRVSTRERVLLRVVVCSQDDKAVSSLYNALEDFRKANGSVHLRVTRADEMQLLALSEPLPDVYVYPPQTQLAPESLFLPLEVLTGDSAARGGATDSDTATADEPGLYGGIRYARAYSPQGASAPLLCAVCANAQHIDMARALVDFLQSAGAGASAP